jgi:phytanoyl-CoA hydroxylase
VSATTATPRRVNDTLLDQYRTDGYFVVRGVLSQHDIERYKTRAREFALGQIPPGADKMVVKEVRIARGAVKPDDPEKGIWKYLNPDRYDPLFAAYPGRSEILDIVEPLVGPDIKAFLMMFIYKPPGIDFVHPYHQDASYFHFEPHEAIVGTWLALDRVDAANGTLSVIRGSHKLPIIPHAAPKGEMVNFGVFGVEGYDGHRDEVTLELDPGEAVFFHSHLLHKTGANLSDRHRRVITVHYASAKCRLTGDHHHSIRFDLVRGRSYDGCI